MNLDEKIKAINCITNKKCWQLINKIDEEPKSSDELMNEIGMGRTFFYQRRKLIVNGLIETKQQHPVNNLLYVNLVTERGKKLLEEIRKMQI